MRRFSDPQVAALFKAYPAAVRAKLMALRELVLDTAARTAGVGPLTETLKWGQPSYLTEETGSGTTVRIDRLKAESGGEKQAKGAHKMKRITLTKCGTHESGKSHPKPEAAP